MPPSTPRRREPPATERRSGSALFRKRVALIIETSNAYARGLLRGIGAWLRANQEPWSLSLPEQSRGGVPRWLARWQGDGIIARIENQAVARAVSRLDVPLVDVSAARLSSRAPWVETDDAAIAEVAFRHLRERGFARFAFCGDHRFNWSSWRQRRFLELAEEAGAPCPVFDVSQPRARLGDWIAALTPPVGLLACYDLLARQVLDACRGRAIPVPESIAVVGVDDDPLLCELSDPPLSSVTPDSEGAGRRAAACLSRLMAGRKPASLEERVLPLGITTRQSTDVLAVEDSMVADALRFIRERGAIGVRVGDLLARSRLSRRVFEARFIRSMGRTPHDHIIQSRMAKVRELLVQTDWSVAKIAEHTGYEHPEYLTVQFTRLAGESPSRYRRRQRADQRDRQ